MELEIQGISKTGPVHDYAKETETKQKKRVTRPVIKEKQNTNTTKVIAEQIEKQTDQIDAAKYLQDILKISHIFNRRLKFIVDDKHNQVIVKVVDKDTDKVIKEIPPPELQRLHARMKEAIGLLIDEQI